MRYKLYDLEGNRIGAARTAQGIADIAQSGTYSYDDTPGIAHPYEAWFAPPEDPGWLVGEPCVNKDEVFAYLRRRGVDTPGNMP